MGLLGKGLTFSVTGAALALNVMPAKAATVVVGFNDPNDVNQFFQNNDGSARTVFNFAANTGINDQAGGTKGGSFFAANPNADATAVYQNNSINLTSGVTTISTLFNFATASGAVRTQLGVVNKPNLSFNGENPPNAAFIAPRVMSDGTVQIQIKPSTGGTNNGPAGLALTGGIQANHWYKLTVGLTETDTAAGIFSVNTTVNDLGLTGTDAPNLVDSNTTNVTVVDFASNSFGQAAFAGVRTANGTQTTLALDNFTVDGNLTPAPEPGTLALLGAGFAGLLARRRR
jgi:hypothetical protein